jgi:hypothetical protein
MARLLVIGDGRRQQEGQTPAPAASVIVGRQEGSASPQRAQSGGVKRRIACQQPSQTGPREG